MNPYYNAKKLELELLSYEESTIILGTVNDKTIRV